MGGTVHPWCWHAPWSSLAIFALSEGFPRSLSLEKRGISSWGREWQAGLGHRDVNQPLCIPLGGWFEVFGRGESGLASAKPTLLLVEVSLLLDQVSLLMDEVSPLLDQVSLLLESPLLALFLMNLCAVQIHTLPWRWDRRLRDFMAGVCVVGYRRAESVQVHVYLIPRRPLFKCVTLSLLLDLFC